MHKVMLHPASYDSCKESVDRVFELFPQKKSGKKVLIKPNVLRASTAEDHIVTHPSLLLAVVEKVEKMSPSEIVVGDNPGIFSYGDNENSFKKSGLMDAAKGYYKNIGNTTQICTFNPDFKLPPPLNAKTVTGNPANLEFLRTRAELRPQADSELCTDCGVCIDHCPVSALTMELTHPVVDADACITCFCCQEMCPEKVMALK